MGFIINFDFIFGIYHLTKEKERGTFIRFCKSIQPPLPWHRKLFRRVQGLGKPGIQVVKIDLPCKQLVID